MTQALIQSALTHLRALVAMDTRFLVGELSREEGIFAYLIETLGEAFDYTFVGDGESSLGLLAVRGERPKHLFCTQLNTTHEGGEWKHPPLELSVADGIATGLGVVNCKGGCAAIVTALEHSTQDVAVFFSLDVRPRSMTSVMQLLEARLLARYDSIEFVFCTEPTCGSAVVEHRGLVMCTGYFNGVAGHASQARALVDSAVHEAMRWGIRALEYASEHQRHTTYDALKGICFNLGKIEGGKAPSLIADHAVVKWAMRPLPSQDPLYMSRQVCELASRPWRVRWEYRHVLPALPAFRAGHALDEVLDITRKYLGRYSIFIGSPVDFWTSAALFSEKGYLACALGPGQISQAGTPNEWVRISELDQCLMGYLYLIDEER